MTLALAPAPFIGPDGRSKLHQHRLYHEPKGGTIIERFEWDGVPMARFRPNSGPDEWRILLPENPILCTSVRMMRAEGPSGLCRKWVEKVARTEPWGIGPEPERSELHRFSPIVTAESEFMRWGTSAPKTGGYDKCDFEVNWGDGSKYVGRFDLEWGGTEAGYGFGNSLRNRVLFYAGLRCPSHMTPESYAMVLNGIEPFGPLCRHLLANCEM